MNRPGTRQHALQHAACPNRFLHGIDFKNPFTMSKREALTLPDTAASDSGTDVFIKLDVVRVVEPIGIEPMT